MSPLDRQHRIVAALEDFQRRRGLGDAPPVEAYRERLGDDYPEFAALVAMADALDRGRDPDVDPPLPRHFGPYVLERVLGGGGMGVVYEALHRDLVRRVAVKVLPRALDADPAMVERFRREARACAQVRHPNVVTVYEAGDVDGRLYYAMELVPGRSLQAHIDDGTVPAPRALCAALAPVADALEVLHAAGVVHRDVKPANLIVRPDGHVVLADFGLARTLYGGALTMTGEALGTPPYMSPEQLLGRAREVDARTDVYGLGATLYHALAGVPPFAAKDAQDLVRMVLAERPDPLRSRRRDVEADVERVVLKALEKRKTDRYVTAGALRDDLRAVAAGRAPAGGPVPRWRRALRAARPYAVPVAAACVLLAAAAVWWLGRPGRLVVSYPLAADVVLDGTVVARVEPDTPRTLELPAGTHRVALVGKGFRTDPEAVRLAPGDSKSYSLRLQARAVTDVEDPDVQRELARTLRLDWARWARVEGVRASTSAPTPLLPRGDARPDDLAVLEVFVPAGVRDDGWVVYAQRDGEDLVPPVRLDVAAASVAVAPPDGFVATVPVPPEARARLRPGDTVRWGVRPRRGDPRAWADLVARVRVAVPDVAAALAEVDAAMEGADPRLRAVFRARTLREHGLATAAARALAADVPAPARGPTAWRVLYDALRGAGVPGDLPPVTEAAAAVKAATAAPAPDAR